MKVRNLLKLVRDDDYCNVVLYAYGIYYAETFVDGMRTVADIKEKLRYDGMQAKVFRICSMEYDEKPYVVICAELVY